MTNERFLQFIWQHALFRPENLHTTTGEPIIIQYTGRRNTHSGPDFEEARIRVDRTLLVGHVELHLKASDWYRHGHQSDKAYDNIILHVVWENDLPADPQSTIPVLELKHHVPLHLLRNYEGLQHTVQLIPCSRQLPGVKEIVRKAWLQRLLAERWEMKFEEWDALLRQNSGDWRVLLYWRLAANFGFKTNATPFLMLAQSLPVNILGRHREQLFRIEALLFGQAGMLEQEFSEDYPFRLKQEYQYLRKKYRLQPISGHLWRFMRMRPANFPSLRIAQFAALVHRSLHLFTRIINSSSLAEMEQLFEVNASAYWDNHVRFGEEQQKSTPKNLGTDSVRNIIVNTIAPIRFLYSARSGLGDHCESALELLEQLPPEHNNIIQEWAGARWKPHHAGESQGLIQLFNRYCSQHKCLECSIGHSIIRNG